MRTDKSSSPVLDPGEGDRAKRNEGLAFTAEPAFKGGLFFAAEATGDARLVVCAATGALTLRCTGRLCFATSMSIDMSPSPFPKGSRIGERTGFARGDAFEAATGERVGTVPERTRAVGTAAFAGAAVRGAVFEDVVFDFFCYNRVN